MSKSQLEPTEAKLKPARTTGIRMVRSGALGVGEGNI